MRPLTKVAAALAVVASLAVGGATLASASSKAPSKAPAGVVDTDNIQQGDQSAPDVPGAPAERSPATRSLSSSKSAPAKASSSKSGSEPAGSESSSEAPGANESGAEAPGSEVPGNDGPGGHADEPGNPNADHQFNGEE